MADPFFIDESFSTLSEVRELVHGRRGHFRIQISDSCLRKVRESHERLVTRLERREPIYGVTTGFGDSCFRRIPPDRSPELQRNLVSYLLCGSGPALPRDAVRATALIRLLSLSRGLSGVSPELLGALRTLIERDWLPTIPREGSLGASGDLVPLAYLARAVQGEGVVETAEGPRALPELLAQSGLTPHRLGPKEGLALVNGTSAMAGLALVNLTHAAFIVDIATVATAWTCLALEGRPDAFSRLVNEQAKQFPGQARVAGEVRRLLEAEGYAPSDRGHQERVQDRYSLRCAPQILGPVLETVELAEKWLELEIRGVSDNPLISDEGELAMGGNFYGGYLAHGMDYLKISLAHVADMADRQVALIVDEHTSRGLPPNLAAWDRMPEADRPLHHGLKGLHQAVSAITSELMARTLPHSVFSRSTESHNQDKVSLGMSAAVGAMELAGGLFRLQAMQLVALAQALELRGRIPRGGRSRRLFELVRESVPFVERDCALDEGVRALAERLMELARK